MNKVTMIVGCAVMTLFAPVKANAFWADICDPDGDRDRDMVNAICGFSKGWKDYAAGKCTLADIEARTKEVQRMARASAGRPTRLAQVALVNNTTHSIRGFQVAPCYSYGGTGPRSFSGVIGPWCGASFDLGAADAHYNVRIETGDGDVISFGELFVGIGVSRIVLTQVGMNRYQLTCM